MTNISKVHLQRVYVVEVGEKVFYHLEVHILRRLVLSLKSLHREERLEFLQASGLCIFQDSQRNPVPA